MQIRDTVGRWLLATVFLALTQQVGAQTLDEVSLEVVGTDVVAHVSFMASVRLVQQTPLAWQGPQAANNVFVAIDGQGRTVVTKA
jgi:hypothetical protein